MGAWTLVYSALLTQTAGLMDEIDGYNAILDRVAARQTREREALRELQAWRDNAVARAQALRVNAVALAPPPSLAVLGEEGRALEQALIRSREDLPLLIDQTVASLEAFAALGAEAIRSPTKIGDARLRAVYESTLQIIRIDLRRLEASAAALTNQHPNRSIIEANIAYYAGLQSLPSYELQTLDGGQPDPAAVAATLRQSAQTMRAEAAEAVTQAERMRREAQLFPAPPEGRDLQRVVIQMMETVPDLAAQYGLLAGTLEQAAAHIEGGGEVTDAWIRQEETAIPIFDQITRLDDRRAQLAAGLQR
jgi:hypothetical protein